MLVACGGGGRPNGGSSPAPAPPAKPTATPLAIKVKSHRVGQHYVYLTEQKNDRVVYVLRADSTQAERLAAGTAHSTFVRPHITFHQPGGRTLVAESPVATVDEETKSVVMSGGVHARTHDGLTLTCDELRYEDATERIHGTGHVVLTTPQGERLSGDVIDADSKLDHVQMHGVSPR
jgi:lipopolysaccharide assembly outer membrane protein LptD (OstA)